MYLPIDLVCVVLRYVTKPEAYVLSKYGFSLTRPEHKSATRVLGITEQDAAEGLAQVGMVKRLERMLERVRAHDRISLQRIMCVAATHGQLAAMQVARNRGADNYARAFMMAARVGQTEPMRTLLAWHRARPAAKSVKDWRPGPSFDVALSEASKGGHLATMTFLKEECDATDFDWAMRMAAANNRVEAMQLLHGWGANSDVAVHVALCAAAGEGQVDAMMQAKRMGAKKDSDDEALAWAAASGKCAIMQMLWNSPDWGLVSPMDACNEALREAAGSESPTAATLWPAIELLRSFGANDWDAALSAAAFRGHCDLMMLFRDAGAIKFEDALLAAVEGGRTEAVRLLLDWRDDRADAGRGARAGTGASAGARLGVSTADTDRVSSSPNPTQRVPDEESRTPSEHATDSLNEALYKSAGRDDVELITLLLERHAYPSSAVEEALVAAASAGSLFAVCALVKGGRARNFTAAIDAACERRAELFTERSERSRQRVLDISATIGALQACEKIYED